MGYKVDFASPCFAGLSDVNHAIVSVPAKLLLPFLDKSLAVSSAEAS
jgi:hypothetical protein